MAKPIQFCKVIIIIIVIVQDLSSWDAQHVEGIFYLAKCGVQWGIKGKGAWKAGTQRACCLSPVPSLRQTTLSEDNILSQD